MHAHFRWRTLLRLPALAHKTAMPSSALCKLSVGPTKRHGAAKPAGPSPPLGLTNAMRRRGNVSVPPAHQVPLLIPTDPTLSNPTGPPPSGLFRLEPSHPGPAAPKPATPPQTLLSHALHPLQHLQAKHCPSPSTPRVSSECSARLGIPTAGCSGLVTVTERLTMTDAQLVPSFGVSYFGRGRGHVS